MTDVQGGNLAANPDYASAWTQATSGASHEARQAGVAAMERIASGGTSGLPAPSPAPTAPANGAAAHRAAYDAVIKMPVGPARDAASLELATLAPSSMPVSYFRDKASNTGDYAEAFAIASDPSAPSNVRDAAIAAMEASAAAGRLASAEPAEAAPTVPAGWEAPAGGLSSYAVPGLPSSKELAQAQADMLAWGVPSWLGKTLLSEGARTAGMLASNATYEAGLRAARATLEKTHGPEKAVELAKQAIALIDRAPLSEARKHDMRGLLLSPLVITKLAELDALGGFPAAKA